MGESVMDENIGPAFRHAVKSLGLVEMVIRESTGGQLQCIAKYRNDIVGPWGVGVDADPIAAIAKALAAGEQINADREAGSASKYRRWEEPVQIDLPATEYADVTANEEYEDLL